MATKLMLPLEAKRALERVLKLGSTIIDMSADGFSKSEWFQLALTSPTIPSIVSDAEAGFKALKSFNPEVSQAIKDEFKIKFDIKNDKLEARIEKVIDLLARTHKVALDATEIAQEAIALYDEIKAA